MKTSRLLLMMICMMTLLSSCSFFQNIFGGGGNKNGCPSNGRNVGAERLATGDPKAEKEAKKAGKFKYNKIPNYNQ